MTMLDMIPFGVYYTHSFGYEEAKRGVVDAGSLSGCTPAVQRGDAKLFVETEALLAQSTLPQKLSKCRTPNISKHGSSFGLQTP